jgi:hypothetical protein
LCVVLYYVSLDAVTRFGPGLSTRVSATLHHTALSGITITSPVSPLLYLPQPYPSLFSVILVAHKMYQRVSQQQAQPEPFTVDFADLSAEDVRLHPFEQTLQPGEPIQDDTASSVSLAATDQPAQEPVKHKKHQSDDADVDVALATLDISQRWYSVAFDAFLSLFPLFFLGRLTLYSDSNSEADLIVFLVIAVLCLLLDGQPISVYGENIKAITLLSPTIFPVVYAAIFGKVLRRIGLFKAERSSTLGMS